MSDDELVEKCIVRLQLARAAIFARCAALEAVKNPKGSVSDDLERFYRAGDHIQASLTFLTQTRFAPETVQLELPW